MPRDHGLWPHRDQRLAPAGPKASQSIACPKPCATTVALKHEHLMAKREQLRLQVSATANQVTNGSEEGHDDGDHRSTLAQSRGMAKRSRIQLRTDFSEGRPCRCFAQAVATYDPELQVIVGVSHGAENNVYVVGGWPPPPEAYAVAPAELLGATMH